MQQISRPAPLRLTRAQVREIDRRSFDEYHIPGVVLMENAARAVVDAAMEMLEGVRQPRVLVVCGGGNNGGDGLATARHLHNRGVVVEVAVAVEEGRYRGDAQTNWEIVQAMCLARLSIREAGASIAGGSVDLVIDALFGTGLQTAPRESAWIDLMNAGRRPILAVDLPSGLDCDTGEPLGAACVRATRTVTFVAEKLGFSNPCSGHYLGEVTVGDIGCPRELIDAVARGDSRPGGAT